MQINFPSDTVARSREVLEIAEKQMRVKGWIEKDIFATKLALDEALANAMKHGNGFDPGKEVKVELEVDSDLVVVTVQDEGEGYDPKDLPDPLAAENLERSCGRGVFLMRQFM